MRSPSLEPITLAILRELVRDARQSMRHLSSVIGLSAPAVTDRVRRLEDVGAICGYRAAIDHSKLGWPVAAFISITARDGRCEALRAELAGISNVLAAFHVAGPIDYVAQVVARDLAELKSLTDRLAGFGSVSSQVVLGVAFERELAF